MTEKTAGAEIPQREKVSFTLSVDEKGIIQKLQYQVWGCHQLLKAAEKASRKWNKKKLLELRWDGQNHWDILINEVLLKLQERFHFPNVEEELCHCRKIPSAHVDQAIILGAKTPEKVRAWTRASSGCGTCRPEIEKLIAFRLKVS